MLSDEYKYPVSSSKGRGPWIPGSDLTSEGEPASSCEQSCEETRSRSRSSIPWQREESLALGFDVSIGPWFYYFYYCTIKVYACMYMEDMELNVRSYCEYNGLKFGVRGYVD
ncbi:unnamed protein product [Prunus armeniaca]|uniref:Uncharacterized protein n=1 Tax=Prunus armeniaca TaxID=36596 RepID=A0A6J5TSG4_PRUAR|nr:unnamed protein product [Prunus armeniaca]